MIINNLVMMINFLKQKIRNNNKRKLLPQKIRKKVKKIIVLKVILMIVITKILVKMIINN